MYEDEGELFYLFSTISWRKERVVASSLDLRTDHAAG